MNKEKIAVVVQRYGEEINGGAEYHAKLLAEHLNQEYNVEVLTTRSLDYITWGNHYPQGESIINKIKVIRFNTDVKDPSFSKAGRYLRKNRKYSTINYSIYNFLWLPFKKWRYNRKNKLEVYNQWVDKQGPTSIDLIHYIETTKQQYAAIIFFTYLYHPTIRGMKVASDKAIFIPTAHDEPPFYYHGFKDVFNQPRFIMYNTLSEKKLVEKTYPETKQIKSDIAGVGFDIPVLDPNYDKIPNTNFRYFVYVGRIEEGKGCKSMIRNFIEFDKLNSENIKLVLIGQNHMSYIPPYNENIIFTGFIEEQEKQYYIDKCEALIIPSKYESLSMVTLEAMAMGKPVLANGKCEVLKDHINASKAGFVFYNKEEFIKILQDVLCLSEETKLQIAANGVSYVKNNYQWPAIISKFEKAIEYVKNGD